MTSRAARTAVPLHPLLAERWSPRAYDPDHELGDDELTALLEAARWAPSRSNRQPWRFLVGRRGDETFKAVHDALVPGNQVWAADASALLVSLAATAGPDGAPYRHTTYDLGLAVAHLAFQAGALGLHTHQMAGFSPRTVHMRFALPEDFEAVTVVAVGRIGDPETLPGHLREREHAERIREPLDRIAFTVQGLPAVP